MKSFLRGFGTPLERDPAVAVGHVGRWPLVMRELLHRPMVTNGNLCRWDETRETIDYHWQIPLDDIHNIIYSETGETRGASESLKNIWNYGENHPRMMILQQPQLKNRAFWGPNLTTPGSPGYRWLFQWHRMVAAKHFNGCVLCVCEAQGDSHWGWFFPEILKSSSSSKNSIFNNIQYQYPPIETWHGNVKCWCSVFCGPM